MPRQDGSEAVVVLLRGLLALMVERERRDGLASNSIAATLARCGMPHVDIAIVLGTSPDAARMAAQRGRRAVRPARASARKRGTDA